MNRLFIFYLLLLAGCGGSSKEDSSFNYYQEKEVESKKLDLTIKASCEIEAIYSVEIKSKASGEILKLPAEVGDYVNKGTILARIDQRTPKNVLDQAPIPVRVIKRLIYQNLNMDLLSSLDLISSHMAFARTSEDHAEAIKASEEKRKPVFKGK